MTPPADVLERERRNEVRWGVYLTVREMELAARALERSRALSARTLARRLQDRAHRIRSYTR
jgi:hypothetical protein